MSTYLEDSYSATCISAIAIEHLFFPLIQSRSATFSSVYNVLDEMYIYSRDIMCTNTRV